ncbi:MAG: hypothetical protein QOI41_3020 [Myxococcales bacterium]|jgi:hypothetical protein|nr:hypothetical protein [Myxococcales bacterium]
MAIDNTPPRLRLIGTIAVIVIITLLSLDFVFKSYYAYMTDEAQREKLAPTTEKNDQREAEAASLSAAKLPIDQAMAAVAKGTRSEAIEPKPSDDMGPMTGWSKLPKQLPLPPAGGMPGGMMVHGASPPSSPPPGTDAMNAGDAGAANAGDAGPTAVDGGPGAADAGALRLAPKTTGTRDAGAKH